MDAPIDGLVMTKEQFERFTTATEHPYTCQCEVCKEWWQLVGPEV